jgi:hypothetical protein
MFCSSLETERFQCQWAAESHPNEAKPAAFQQQQWETPGFFLSRWSLTHVLRSKNKGAMITNISHPKFHRFGK